MMINQLFRAANIYIALWLLYNLQGVLYSSGSVISASILAILIFWSILNFFKANTFSPKPKLFSGLNALLLLFTIYGGILIISGEQLYITEFGYTKVRNFEYLKGIYSSLLPIYSFYYFTKTNQITENSLQNWVYIFFIVAILQYYRAQHDNMARLIAFGSSSEEATNNSGYLFLSLIPCLMLFKHKPVLQYIGLSVCMGFILMAMKRGAIIIGALTVVYFLWMNLKLASKKTKFSILVISIVICIFGYYAVIHMLDTSDYFNARLQDTIDGDDSNRSIMYSQLWHAFRYDANIIQTLFGRGAWGTLTVNINYAHNDWLEILTNQGLFGIVIFIYYWICFYKSSKSKMIGNDCRICITLAFIICFSKALFSMSYSAMSIYICCILGYSITDNPRS